MKTKKQGLSRRDFFKSSVIGGTSLLASQSLNQEHVFAQSEIKSGYVPPPAGQKLDLAPAKWLWYPSERCLPNTFILFRKEIDLIEKPVKAAGWILGDSRYLLNVNGRRVQFGPAPCDPRWSEADPMDLTDFLKTGLNEIGSTVLYYGFGDGTWPVGKPGFIFYLEIQFSSGIKETLVSDGSWNSFLAKSWRPGHYKRWYLRALQEEFDARLYPYGWTTPDFRLTGDWLPAMELKNAPDKPALCSDFYDYLGDSSGNTELCQLRARQIPHMLEAPVPVQKLAESWRIVWKRPPEEYFDCKTPDAFSAEKLYVNQAANGTWEVEPGQNAVALTFELKEQIVGWPYFTIDAQEGTVVELMTHEAHQPGGPVLLNTHFNSWTRFICRAGENTFETFDFESLRWLQLHIHNTGGAVTVKNVGVRRRRYPWPYQPDIKCSDKTVQSLVNACVNTLYNSAQETVVDGMGRERQQYSGDGGHQLHAIYYAFGDSKLPERFINTYSQGLTKDGFFLDCWPAYDRLARLAERQLDLTPWGPLLDHGVGFNFDCYYYYLYTGNIEALVEVYPRLLRFFAYLKKLRGKDGLLPVVDTGVPWVWIDFEAFQQQRHKQCAFNLYAAAMMEHALSPICRAFKDVEMEKAVKDMGQELLRNTQKQFWSDKHGLFVNNLPWLTEEKGMSLDDRSLSTAILFDLCPNGQTNAAVKALAETPKELGLSYPANAGWRLWALAKGGRVDKIFEDFESRWIKMESVTLNNTMQEGWHALPDSGSQWSHCPVAPLYVLYMSIAGINPLEPGYATYQIRPQLGKLSKLELTAHTVKGPIHFKSVGKSGNRKLTLVSPASGQGELVLDSREVIDLPVIKINKQHNTKHYQLPVGKEIILNLKYT